MTSRHYDTKLQEAIPAIRRVGDSRSTGSRGPAENLARAVFRLRVDDSPMASTCHMCHYCRALVVPPAPLVGIYRRSGRRGGPNEPPPTGSGAVFRPETHKPNQIAPSVLPTDKPIRACETNGRRVPCQERTCAQIRGPSRLPQLGDKRRTVNTVRLGYGNRGRDRARRDPVRAASKPCAS